MSPLWNRCSNCPLILPKATFLHIAKSANMRFWGGKGVSMPLCIIFQLNCSYKRSQAFLGGNNASQDLQSPGKTMNIPTPMTSPTSRSRCLRLSRPHLLSLEIFLWLRYWTLLEAGVVGPCQITGGQIRIQCDISLHFNAMYIQSTHPDVCGGQLLQPP